MEIYLDKKTSSFAKVAEAAAKSPLLTRNSLPRGKVIGDLHETGVVVVENGRVIASVKSPRHIPSESGTFGGQQREGHIEGSLAMELGPDQSRESSLALLKMLSSTSNLTQISRTFGGAFAVGVETESVRLNPRTWEIDNTFGGDELCKGQRETPHFPPSPTPNHFLKTKARYVLEELSKPPHIETSAPVYGQSHLVEANFDQPGLGPYVYVISTFLLSLLDRDYDPQAWQVWDQIARNENFKNMEELFAVNGTLGPWFMNALHMSVGVAHYETQGIHFVSIEDLIGTSDLVSSCLGAPVGWMTASTPVMFGVEPTVDRLPIKDVRLEGRHLLSTSGPDTIPLLTVSEFTRRTVDNIVHGQANTLARAAYNSSRNPNYAVMHGQSRVRHEGKFGKVGSDPTGRVEATGIGATPNLLDQVAAFGYLQILYALCKEAQVSNMPAVIYASEKLGLKSAGSFAVRQANAAFNRYDRHPLVDEISLDAIRLIRYMRQEYKALEESCFVAEKGINRLSQAPAADLSDYLRHPRGSFAHAVRNEYHKDYDPIHLSQAIYKFQQTQARSAIAQ